MYKSEFHYTLYKRGKIWGYYYYDKDNHRHYRSTGRKTKYEAVNVIMERIKNEEFQYKQIKNNPIFSDYASNFYIIGKCPILIENARTGRKLAETSRVTYQLQIKTHLIPFFGKYRLSEINPELIKKFQTNYQEKGISNTTIQNYLYPLRSILNQAVKDDLILINPMNKIDNLKKEESIRHAFTLEQVKSILDSEWNNIICKIAFKLACLTGLRMGEILGLRVCSVNENNLIISNSYSSNLKLLKDTKNHHMRIVPYPEEIRDDLNWLMKDREPNDYIFSYNGKTPIIQNLISLELSKIKKKLGINDKGLTFHSARHFFNSYLYLNGEVDKERIMAVTGHLSEEMFRHYLTIQKDDLEPVRNAVNELGGLLRSKK